MRVNLLKGLGYFFFLVVAMGLLDVGQAYAQGMALPGVSINLGQGADLVDTMQLLALFTVLTLAPAILVLCTCFTRIIVVLSFMRQALGTQNMPPNQLLIGLALFLSVFVMQPVGKRIYDRGIAPYVAKKMTTVEVLGVIETELRGFMNKQVRKSDIALFYDVTGAALPASIDDVPIHFLVPAFVISELKAAFQIGFLLYIPFLILDMIVASVLMAMGMMMLPPIIVSLPFKLLLFVLVDGWQLVTGSILRSFNT